MALEAINLSREISLRFRRMHLQSAANVCPSIHFGSCLGEKKSEEERMMGQQSYLCIYSLVFHKGRKIFDAADNKKAFDSESCMMFEIKCSLAVWNATNAFRHVFSLFIGRHEFTAQSVE